MNERIERLNAAMLAFSKATDALLQAQADLETDEYTEQQQRTLNKFYEGFPFAGDVNLADLAEKIAVWQTNVLIASKE